MLPSTCLMPAKRIIPLVLVTIGCAGAPVAKIPFEEAFGRPPSRVPLARASSDPRTSPELHAALFAFSDRVEAARVGVPRGQKMPPVPTQAWLTVLGELDQFLSRAPQKTSPFDLVRARLVLQTQLVSDAQLYGDFPAAVADGAQRSIGLLSSRLALVSPPRPRADLRRFVWPLEPIVITSPFGHRFHPITGSYRFHSGLDLLADPAQPVRAAFDGVVVFSAWNGSHGKQIELQHDPTLATRYSHLQTLLVSEGTPVKRGQVIGLAGSTGKSTGVHLHFELTRNGLPENPEDAIAQNGTSPGFPQSSSELPSTVLDRTARR
jgi:murein DD-endopeptidase MepM/ murein hydrolase activator NlpD